MGARLKELRMKAGLSQARLAAAVGVSPRTVQYWEFGNRTFDFESAWKLADALGITLDRLAGRDRVPPPPKPEPVRRGRKPKGGAK